MKTLRRSLWWAVVALVGLAVGCGGAASSGGVVLVVVGFGIVLGAWPRAAAAGGGAPTATSAEDGASVGAPHTGMPVVLPGGAPMPPPPCDGTRVESCVGGSVHVTCCPAGEKCPAVAEFRHCGDGRCVDGKDVGMCAPREVHSVVAPNEAECVTSGAAWVKACVKGRVAMACLPPVPTNYTGPPQNPSFVTCGGDRCSVATHPELCFEERSADDSACLGTWTKACVKGRISERCVPVFKGAGAASIRAFSDCGGGRCVIGADVSACE